MSAGKKVLIKNITYLGVVQIANYILPLLSVPIISRIIGPDKFGIINFVGAFVGYFSIFIGYGFDLTATRKIAKDPGNSDNLNSVFSEVFYTQCLLFFIATIAFAILFFIVPELRAEKYITIFSFLFCVGVLFTQNWLFQAMQDLQKIAVFNFISKLLFTIVVLIVVRKKDDYIFLPLLSGIIQIIIALLSFFWAIKKYKIQFVKVSINRCLQLLWEEKMIFLSIVVVSLYTTTNTVILGLYQSAEQVGYYTAGARLISIGQSVLAIPLAQALFPFIGKAFGESKKRGINVAQKLLPLLILFTGLASIVIFMIGPYFLTIFFGHKFESAIPVLQILAFIPLVVSLNNVFGTQIMLNLKMDKPFFRITVLGAVLSITLNMLLIRQWSYIGTAINWLVTESFITVSMYIALRQKGISPLEINYFKFSIFSTYLQRIKTNYFVR